MIINFKDLGFDPNDPTLYTKEREEYNSRFASLFDEFENRFQHIPSEMIAFNQWVVWALEPRPGSDKPTKMPYTKSGQRASVSDPSTWMSYHDAISYLIQSRISGNEAVQGIGFVLTKADPFVFIDLDKTDEPVNIELQRQIKEAFADTYMELSPSGQGVHIIARGGIESGKRKFACEMYDSDRYMTMTGNIIGDCQTISGKYQHVIDSLWVKLGGESGNQTPIVGKNEPERYSDDLLIEKASNAKNGEKFKALWAGDWKPLYPSQSDADQALVDMIGFYSENDIQIVRLFRRSALGQRDKAIRPDYCFNMARKSHDQKLPSISEIPFDKLKYETYKPSDDYDPKKLTNYGTDCPEYIPEGLIKYVYDLSMRITGNPNPLFSLCAGFAFMAGISSRAYSFDGDGLNLYVVALGRTGIGKSQMTEALNYINRHIKTSVIGCFNWLGSCDFTAQSSLQRELIETPCFLTTVPEFHKSFRNWVDDDNKYSIGPMIRNLYSMSNLNGVLPARSYSDSKNKIQAVESPCFSLLGECTSNEFWAEVEDEFVSDGLINRILIFESTADVEYPKEKTAAFMPKNELDDISTFASTCNKNFRTGRNAIAIDASAKAYIEKIEMEKVDKMRSHPDGSIERCLLSRCVQNAKRIAALMALSRAFGYEKTEPVVLLPDVEWAWKFVNAGIDKVIKRFRNFDTGKISNLENKQVLALKRLVLEILAYDDHKISMYKLKRELIKDYLIPRSHVQMRCNSISCFKEDRRRGQHSALDKTFEILIDQGILGNPSNEDLEKCGRAKCYRVTDYQKLVDHLNGVLS